MPRPKGDTARKATLSGTGHKVLIDLGQFYHHVYKTNPKLWFLFISKNAKFKIFYLRWKCFYTQSLQLASTIRVKKQNPIKQKKNQTHPSSHLIYQICGRSHNIYIRIHLQGQQVVLSYHTFWNSQQRRQQKKLQISLCSSSYLEYFYLCKFFKWSLTGPHVEGHWNFKILMPRPIPWYFYLIVHYYASNANEETEAIMELKYLAPNYIPNKWQSCFTPDPSDSKFLPLARQQTYNCLGFKYLGAN